MIIAHVAEEIQRFIPGFDQASLTGLVDKILPFTPPITEEMLTALTATWDDQHVVIARNPEAAGASGRENVPVELANRDSNPGNVAFVDLNAIIPICGDGESFLHQLRIHLTLSLRRRQQTANHPRLATVPLNTVLLIGKPPAADLEQALVAGGLKVVHLWSGTDDDADTMPVQLAGLPGHYRLTCRDAAGVETVIEMGAAAIFGTLLTVEQRKALSAGLLLPERHARLHLPPHQLRLSQGIKILDGSEPTQTASNHFLALLRQQEASHFVEDPVIDHEKCGLCGTCVKTCMFHASSIEQVGNTMLSVIHRQYCVACGNCVTACPTQARDLPAYSYAYYASAWQELRSFRGDDNGLRILVIYCAANGHDAVRHLATTGERIPAACLLFKIRCGARVDTQFIPDSFRAGFDGVAVLVCSRHECGNIVGSLDLERRLNLYRKVMQASGIETGRMRILPVASHQLENVGEALWQFAEFLEHVKQDRQLFSSIMR